VGDLCLSCDMERHLYAGAAGAAADMIGM
jgi:hypothetical protein